MLVKNPKFEISAVSPKQYPKNNLPEIVLVGKSNVGKSSFINTMINRKKLARTSSEPGKTRQINFYNIDETFYFVDLPGYGYSKMSKKEQEQISCFLDKKRNEINSTVNRIEQQITKLQEYKKSIISEAVTGKIKIEKYINEGVI